MRKVGMRTPRLKAQTAPGHDYLSVPFPLAKIQLEKHSALETIRVLHMKRLLLLLCILTLIPLNPAQAKGKGKPQPRKPQPKVEAGGATIGAVSGTSITVGKQTYAITGKTSITVDGRKAAAGALRAGMLASVTASGLEPGSASSISAQSSK